MTGLRVLVADDERPAREKLRRFLEDSPAVSVIFEARDGATAMDIVTAEAPDVVFLDIHMPNLDGLAAAESMVRDDGPYVVFVTAHDEHAIRAFELGATDYLLKPFDRARFETALSRVQAAVAGEHVTADVHRLKDVFRLLQANASPTLERVLVEDGGRSRLLALADVIRFESNRNYVRVVARDGEFRVRGTMRDLEQRLDSRTFARVNRSQIVNLDRARDFAPAGHGDLDVRMEDGTTVRLSRRYRDRVGELGG